MSARIDVRFQNVERDPSVESAIDHWVIRLAAVHVDIKQALVTVEGLGRRRVMVCVTAVLSDGTWRTSDRVHSEIYVAVADAFRNLRQQQTRPIVDHARMVA